MILKKMSSSRDLPDPRETTKKVIDDGRVKLLFVGRYHYNKGPDLLLEAVQQLPQVLKAKLDLHMFGIGLMKKKLVKYVEKNDLYGSVSIHDGIEAQDFTDELARTDYLVIPSRVESLPVVFSDAMQMGIPVIATPSGDLGEVLKEHPCGILADNISVAALARALESGLNSRRRNDYVEEAKSLGRTYCVAKTVEKWTSS